jgi:Ni/Co efflux regulator RcnB
LARLSPMRPAPARFKDWTEAKVGRVDRRQGWRDAMAGSKTPPPFTGDDLAKWRSGPAVEDPSLVIGVGRWEDGCDLEVHERSGRNMGSVADWAEYSLASLTVCIEGEATP